MSGNSRWQKLRKRLTRTTYEPYSYDFKAYLTQATNPYNDDITLRTLYEEEPVISGIIDTQTNAIFAPYDFNFKRTKPRKNEKDVKDQYVEWTERSINRFNQKIRSMAVKSLTDNLYYLEVDPEAENFYVLNKGNCEIVWNEENTALSGLNWFKESVPQGKIRGEEIAAKFIPIERIVIGSFHDMDTDLWQSAPLRSLIESANILYHARNYNNDIFRSGGMPSFAYIFKTGVNKGVFDKTVKEANSVKPGKNLFFKGDVEIKQVGGFNKDMEYEKLVKYAIQDCMIALNSSPLMTNLIDKNGGEDKNEFNSFSEKIHTHQSIINDSINEVLEKIFTNPIQKSYSLEIKKAFDDKRMSTDSRLDKIKKIRDKRSNNPYKKVKFKLREWVDLRLLSAVQHIWLTDGVINPNEARKQLGLEEREGGDVYLTDMEEQKQMPLGNVGGAQPSSATSRGQEKTKTGEEPKKKPTAKQQVDK